MHRMIVLYSEPDDRAAFRQYYEEVHLPLVRTIPGLLDSRNSFAVRSEGGAAPLYAVWEGEFATRQAMDAALETAEGRAVHDDISNYARADSVMVIDYEL